MLRRLGSSLGLREGEGSRSARLFFFIFLLTAAAVLAKSAQREIFLAAYPRTAIPDAFLLSAAVLSLAALAITTLAARLGLMRLMQVLLAVGAVLLVAGRLGMAYLPAAAPMAVYVIVEVMISLVLTQGWAVASEAVDVRSAKRLLPVVGIGAGIAWTVGGLAIGLLAKWVGPTTLLLLAPLSLAGASAVLSSVWKKDITEERGGGRVEGGLFSGVLAGLAYIASEPLMRVLAAIITIELVVEKVTDLQLLVVAQEIGRAHV